MTKKYIVVDKENIVNVVESEKEYSELEIIKLFYPKEYTVIEINANETIFSNSKFIKNKITPPSPHDSWIFNGNEWTSPEPYPVDNKTYVWDENEKKWQLPINLKNVEFEV